MKPLPVFLLSVSISTLMTVEGKIDYNRDVRPILAGKCYACHGPDKETRKAKLRLDLREVALKNKVIVPGKIEESEFHYRIRSDDPDEIMPPPESHATLTENEKDFLDQWIKEGAKYDKHWAFVPPLPPLLPEKIRSGPETESIPSFSKISRGMTLSPLQKLTATA